MPGVYFRWRERIHGISPWLEDELDSLYAGLQTIWDQISTLSTGGTGSDLSTTGPGYLKQLSAGAAVSVGPLLTPDLGTGSADSSTFLRGDRTWAAPAASLLWFVGPLGGSRQQGVRHSTWTPAPEYTEVVLDTTKIGTSVVVRVEVKTENAATSVTPRLWNVTDGSAAGTGTASTSTSWSAQAFTATLPAGEKRYRLELLPSTTTHQVFGTGTVEPYTGIWGGSFPVLVYNVKDYGAAGDGVTDDAAAIQSALNAGAGKLVYFPAGTYLVGTTLKVPSSTTVRGQGRDATTIKRKSGAAIWLMENADRATTGNTDISVSGLTFDGARTGTTDIPTRWGCYFSRMARLTVSECAFKSCDSDGLTIEFTNNATVVNNRCTDNVKVGIYLSCCDHVIVSENTVSDCLTSVAYGIALACCWYCTVSANVLWGIPNYGIGLGRDSRYNIIDGNTAEGLGTESEVIPAGYATYLATVTRPGGGTAGDGISYTAYNNTISNNVFSNTVTTDDRNGMRLSQAHRNLIIGNTIGEHGRCGIYLYQSTDNTISGNHIFNVGKHTVYHFGILADGGGGVYCDRTHITNNLITDTQGVQTTYGLQVVGTTCANVLVAFNRFAVTNYPLYEDGSTATLRKFGNVLSSTFYGPAVGTFTMAAAASKAVTETRVTSGSKIVLQATNAAAATLMSGASALYISATTAGTSFTVTTANGASAAGTETFNYWLMD